MSKYQTLNEAYLSVYDNTVEEEFVPLNKDKEKRVFNRLGDLTRKSQLLGARAKELKNKPLSRFRPGVKKELLATAKRGKTVTKLARNAGMALLKTGEHKITKMDQASQEKAKKIGALKSIIGALSPHNKIVKFQREEFEFVLDYLFENGYADTYSSAEAILESMSDVWLEDILCEWGTMRKKTPEELKRYVEVLRKLADQQEKIRSEFSKPISQKSQDKPRQRSLNLKDVQIR